MTDSPDALIARLREHAWMTSVYPHWAAVVNDMADAAALLTTLQQERDAARAALREVEWVFDREETCNYCAACSRAQRDGHTPDCVVAAALTP